MDQIFPACHLIPFRRPETDDIFLLTKEPLDIDKSLLAKFKLKLKENVKEGVKFKPFLDDFDRMRLFGSKKSFDEVTKTTSTRTSIRARNPSLEVGGPFVFKYSFIQKTPCEDRAALLTSASTLNTMQLLRLQLEAVRSAPEDMFPVKDFSWLESWLGSKNFLYLMSDQRKAGLTFPRQLFVAGLEALDECYPEWDFKLGISGYSSAKVLIQNEWYSVSNGVGLGMMNEYVSFFTSILYQIWSDENVLPEYTTALMYNDDQVIRVRNTLELGILEQQELGASWNSHMESYGLQVHAKKPFWSDRGVFLEVFGDPSSPPFKLYKDTQYIGNLYNVLLCSTIVEAKTLVSSIFDNMPCRLIPRATRVLEWIIDVFGYEFAPEEIMYSYPIGWVRNKNAEGESLLLREIYQSHGNTARMAPVALCVLPRATNHKVLKSLKNFESVHKWFYHELEEGIPMFTEQLRINPSGVSVKPQTRMKSWKHLSDERQKAWRSPKRDPTDIIIDILSKDINENLELPYEYFKKTSRGTKCFIPEVPLEDISITSREWVHFGQQYGMYKGVRVFLKDPDSSLERVKRYLSAPGYTPEAWKLLVSNFDRKKIIHLIDTMKIHTSEFFIPSAWSPKWDFSKLCQMGDVISYDKLTGELMFSKPEEFSTLSRQYGVEYAGILCQVAKISSLLEVQLAEREIKEILFVLETEKEGKLRTSEINHQSTPNPMDAENQQTREILEEYIKYQFQGVWGRLGLQLDHEQRRDEMTQLGVYGDPDSYCNDSDLEGMGDMFS
jgi:hypothetical protein